MKLSTLPKRLSTLHPGRVQTLEAGQTPRPAGRAWQETRTRIAVRDRCICAKCGMLWRPSQDMVDHITPRWAGGSDDDSNLWLLHADPCHVTKSAEEAAMRAAGAYVMPQWIADLLAARRRA